MDLILIMAKYDIVVLINLLWCSLFLALTETLFRETLRFSCVNKETCLPTMCGRELSRVAVGGGLQLVIEFVWSLC